MSRVVHGAALDPAFGMRADSGRAAPSDALLQLDSEAAK